jgi:hypothetical protein
MTTQHTDALQELTAGEIDLVAGGADNSWAFEIMPGIIIGRVDDGQGPAFSFGCSRGGNTLTCVVF